MDPRDVSDPSEDPTETRKIKHDSVSRNQACPSVLSRDTQPQNLMYEF